ncbi:MAG: hypothetical protein PHI11_09235 [Gallionella sp.]|nr:hypothetical protein [Gallionella sp.]
MKTVRLTLSPDNFSQVGKIDAQRVDATTEVEIAQHIVADEVDALANPRLNELVAGINAGDLPRDAEWEALPAVGNDAI